ncbi:MAG: hypothetical protein GY832_22850 [Chloroflexi bacterium]|nr:hypothetical protein [Chloroflexota bacterium]
MGDLNIPVIPLWVLWAGVFGISKVYRTMISPVIGTHAGPGTVGLAFCVK